MIGRLDFIKLMLFFLLFCVIKNASAFTCKTSTGETIPPGGSSTPVNISVAIWPSLQNGKNQISSLSQVTCKNDIPSWTDYLELNSVFVFPAASKGLKYGVTIEGVDYDMDTPSIMKRVLSVTGGKTATVPMDLYIKLDKKPSKDLLIKKGERVAVVSFIQSNDQAGCPYCGPYLWNLIANNDAYFSTTTCSINGAKQINVDFGRISQDSFTENVSEATIKKEQEITYWCEDTTASQDILIRLVGGVSGFSSDAIATSNNNIGVAMMHKGKLVKPNESFRTQIRNGVGSDTITFVPIKSKKPSSDISTGPFSGSATLIFSIP